MILTASLTSGTVRIARGREKCIELVNYIFTLDHEDWETTLNVGDVAFYQSRKDGPFPDHQLRVSVRPSLGVAALNYTDNNDSDMTIVDSLNPNPISPEVMLIFNGATAAVFPASAAIPMAEAKRAVLEWLETRRRPTSIQWARYDEY
jgi:hypothetical protein